eukprot:6637065-Prymnesium_polylepis.2
MPPGDAQTIADGCANAEAGKRGNRRGDRLPGDGAQNEGAACEYEQKNVTLGPCCRRNQGPRMPRAGRNRRSRRRRT